MGKCQLTSCPLHTNSGYKEIPYAGPTNAKVIFVGESESPSRGMDKTVPFSASTDYGKLLRKGCSTIQLPWSSLFIANSTRCRINVKKMTTKEITRTLANCRRHIERLMKTLKPKIIVAMGNFALQQIIKKKGITKARGTWTWNKEFNCWVFCMFHPAYIIRNMALEPLFIEDLTQIKEAIDNNYSPEFDDVTDWKEVSTLKGLFTKEQLKGGIGIDTEGQGLEWTDPQYVVIGYSVSAKEGEGYFVRLYEETKKQKDAVFSFKWMRAPAGKKKKELMPVYVKKSQGFQQKLKELRVVLESKDIKLYMHNGNFDVHAFTALYRNAKQPIPVIRSYAMDTQAAAQLIEENIFTQCRLTQLQRTFTNIRGDYDGDFAKRWGKSDMLAVDKEELGFYGAGDADTTRRSAVRLKSELLKNKDLARYFVKFVMPTLQSLARMEENGAYVDQKQLPIATESIKKLMDKATEDCLKYVPKNVKALHKKKGLRFTRDFFIRDTLFGENGYRLKPVKMTKGREPSVDKDVRKILLNRRLTKRCRAFLTYLDDFKRYHTLYTRYLKGFKKSIKHDGFIHTKYSLSKAKTGRVASSDPNLMNIPKRGPDAPVVRRLICAPKGWLLLAADEAQSELRWAAMIANDPAMKRVFKENRDIHTATAIALSGKAEAIYHKLPQKEQDKLRRNAKPVNFGLLYGMHAAGFVLYAKLEYGIDLTIPEAELWISIFFRTYNRLPVYHRTTIEFCRRYGYVESPIGRRRRLPEINSKDTMLRLSAERMAINHPIQSVSSDTVLMADNEIGEQDYNPEEFKSSLFIHDELIYLVKDNSKVEDYGKILKYEMEHPQFERDFGYTLTVPMASDVKVGKNLVDMEVLNL